MHTKDKKLANIINKRLRIFLAYKPSMHLVLIFIKTLFVDFFLKFFYKVNFNYHPDSTFTNDWFLSNIKRFNFYLNKYFNESSSIKILELGSWEGRASLYLSSKFPQAEVLCIDTWRGSDEHSEVNMSTIESNFDNNILSAKNIKKIKSNSSAFFEKNKSYFDLIYLDASHSYADAYNDLNNSYQALKTNGLLIFDDYLWDYYKKPTDNAGYALNFFIKKNKNIKIIYLGYQAILQKR